MWVLRKEGDEWVWYQEGQRANHSRAFTLDEAWHVGKAIGVPLAPAN